MKLASQLPFPGSLWMALTCLEGSSEDLVGWRMDGIPDLMKVQVERYQHVK